MKKKRRETRFEKLTRRLLMFSFALFVVGVVGLNSYESSLNIDSQKVEQEITSLESDIDGLNMKKQELESFSRVSSIAEKKGYEYKQNTVTAAVEGIHAE